jgi:hypothetical protein
VNAFKDRFLHADEMSADKSWQLVEWCANRGANEFSVLMLSLQGLPEPFLDTVRRELAPFQRTTAPRRRMTVFAGEELIQPTQLWSLTAASVDLLKGYFHSGLFTYPTSEWDQGCLEDPVIYRSGEVILGIVSHEQEGILILSDSEHHDVAALGIRTHEHAQWI